MWVQASLDQQQAHLLALVGLELGVQQAPGHTLVQLKQGVLQAAQHWGILEEGGERSRAAHGRSGMAQGRRGQSCDGGMWLASCMLHSALQATLCNNVMPTIFPALVMNARASMSTPPALQLPPLPHGFAPACSTSLPCSSSSRSL